MAVFEDMVYNLAKDSFGTRETKKRRPSPKKRHSRLLNKIKGIKNRARKVFRNSKRTRTNTNIAFKNMIKAVRVHTDLL